MAGFDIIVTVEIKPHPGSSIMEKPASANKIVVGADSNPNRAGGAQMAGHMAYEAACALLDIETRPERMVKMTEAELQALYGAR